MHTILDEIIFGGQVVETSSAEVMKAVEEISRSLSLSLSLCVCVRGCAFVTPQIPLSGLDLRNRLITVHKSSTTTTMSTNTLAN